MGAAIVIVATVLLVAAGAFVLLRQPHPEDLSADDDEVRRETTSDRLYGKADRPAGPDAEL